MSIITLLKYVRVFYKIIIEHIIEGIIILLLPNIPINYKLTNILIG